MRSIRKVTSLVPNRKIAGAPMSQPTSASSVHQRRKPSVVVSAASTPEGLALTRVLAAINSIAVLRSKMQASLGQGRVIAGVVGPRRRRQMPQLVRIAHHVNRPNHVALDLERCRLHRPLGCVHDDTGKPVDGCQAHREFLAPPLTWVWARSVDQEPRRALGADVDYLQR